MSTSIPRVGFDLDGVILYNPARIVRPFVKALKKKLLRKDKVGFYVPQSSFSQQLWRVFHWSSLGIAPGLERIKKLSATKQIDPWIVTARYSFLKNDFQHWVTKGKLHQFFRGCYSNEADEQPHLYKERMIRELKLDVFVEDNLDIVTHLKQVFPEKEIIWIYNIFDKSTQHSPKFPDLASAVQYLVTTVIPLHRAPQRSTERSAYRTRDVIPPVLHPDGRPRKPLAKSAHRQDRSSSMSNPTKREGGPRQQSSRPLPSRSPSSQQSRALSPQPAPSRSAQPPYKR